MYALSDGALPVPDGCTSHTLEGLQLIAGPAMPVHSLVDPTGRVIGWLLGWAVSPGGMVAGQHTLNPANLEEELYRLAGGWIAVLPRAKRVYQDPLSCLGGVFSPALRRFAPTSAWMPEADVDPDLAEAMNIPVNPRYYYPFGLTPRQGCVRLMPNHFLDLDQWIAVRHWPKERLPDVTPQDAIRNVGSTTEHVIRAFAPLAPYMALTAGRDTRLVVACSHGVASSVEYFTFEINDRQGHIDVDTARRLARRARLRHRVLKSLPAGQEELTAWQQRADYSVAGRTWKSVRTMRQLDSGRPWLTGAAGEAAKGQYWRPGDADDVPLTAQQVAARLHPPTVPAVVAAAERWLSELPAIGTFQLLDLLYLEMRTGCWGAPQGAAHSESAYRLHPLANRSALTSMIGLPPAYKLSRAFHRDMCLDRWPELATLPFNKPVGWLALVRKGVSLRKRIAALLH